MRGKAFAIQRTCRCLAPGIRQHRTVMDELELAINPMVNVERKTDKDDALDNTNPVKRTKANQSERGPCAQVRNRLGVLNATRISGTEVSPGPLARAIYKTSDASP